MFSTVISKMLSVHLQMVHVSDACLSDYHKDAYGFRPHYSKMWWTYDEVEAEIDHLCKESEAEYKRECARQELALKEFEELVKETMSYGAKDRETAIRWLMDGEDVDLHYKQDVEHFFWKHGLSFEKIDEFTKKFYKEDAYWN